MIKNIRLSQLLSDYFNAYINTLIFLPYFFSVIQLLKSLFSPWKNIYTKDTSVGFDFGKICNVIFYNLISSVMGFSMRSALLITYLIVQILLFLWFPIIILFFPIFIPFAYIYVFFSSSDEQKYLRAEQRFLKTHALDQNNAGKVKEWFKIWHTSQLQTPWWNLNHLFKIRPLARDWTMGFTPNLDQYCVDLTATSTETHHIFGRSKEIQIVERILSKTEEPNVLLVGDEGVGKHAIVTCLASHIYYGNCLPPLKYKRILSLNIDKISSHAQDQTGRIALLETLFEEAVWAKNIIFCIDDIDRYISLTDQHTDITQLLEKFTRKMSLQIIGITTPSLYESKIVTNDRVQRLFSKMDIYEVAKSEALQILFTNFNQMENRYNIILPYETLIYSLEKSMYYITSIPFPEKVLQLLDQACIYAVERKQAILTQEIIDIVLTQITHVPSLLSHNMKSKLIELESLLLFQIQNQNEAIAMISSTMRTSFLQMGKRDKPLTTFLFIGPTGVGKTECAKQIASIFFESEKKLLRLDMSEYQTKQDVLKLIGSSENHTTGFLTELIQQTPYGVLLLDEIEKAEPSLLNVFLSILDEGYFTNGYGKKINCKNLVIIATSNTGAQFIRNNEENDYEKNKEKLVQFILEHNLISPEFLNRFEGIVYFKTLHKEDIYPIAEQVVKHEIQDIYNQHGVKLSVSKNTLVSIIDNHYNPEFGARDIKRIIKKYIEDSISKKILSEELTKGSSFTI
ncbi:MAG: AAA family ATPase [Candidatus Roizmanbacteria bacterium]